MLVTPPLGRQGRADPGTHWPVRLAYLVSLVRDLVSNKQATTKGADAYRKIIKTVS